MPNRSKLTPFEAEIAELRRTRPPTPYTEIVRVLKERHGLAVQVSTLFNFVKVRRKWDRLHRLASQPSTVAASASAQRSLPKLGTAPHRVPRLLARLFLAMENRRCFAKTLVAEP
jgi:hypothetical protein